MLATELSGGLHVLKCNVQALVAFHSANGGCVILDLHLCHLPRLFRRPFPRSQFTRCHFLSLRPHALASIAAQPDLSQDSALSPQSGWATAPVSAAPAAPPGPSDRDAPQREPLEGPALWLHLHGCWPGSMPREGFHLATLSPKLSNKLSWKQGGHSASRKRRRLQNSWILLP